MCEEVKFLIHSIINDEGGYRSPDTLVCSRSKNLEITGSLE